MGVELLVIIDIIGGSVKVGAAASPTLPGFRLAFFPLFDPVLKHLIIKGNHGEGSDLR